MFATFFFLPRASCFDDVRVYLGYFPLSNVSSPILGQWEPWEHEFDGRKPVVQVVVQFRECVSSFSRTSFLCKDLEAVKRVIRAIIGGS